MPLTKQAKVLTKKQIELLARDLRVKRNGLRNETIFLLSAKGGLRAKEIAELKWIHVLRSDNSIDDFIRLPDSASKGRGGREIPIHHTIRANLHELFEQRSSESCFDPLTAHVIATERSPRTSAQVIVNLFQRIYRDYGLSGCSSHSGRRTFITDISRKISMVGGSMRDVQYLAGHSSLQTTQRYVEGCSESKVKVVSLI
jgi:integrase/recombinase XerD